MSSKPFVYVFMIVVLGMWAAACSSEQPKVVQGIPTTPASAPAASPATAAGSPSAAASSTSSFTAADVAKLKWLEGSYRVSGGDKLVFNRYRINGTTMTIESFDDEAMTKKSNSALYTLKDGVFASPEGNGQFKATEITGDHVRFVSDPAHSFKMEKQADSTVTATTESIGPDGRADKKTFTLERLKK